MKFARFWQSMKISVDGGKFGMPELTVWGASNESDIKALEIFGVRAKALDGEKFKKQVNSKDIILNGR